MAEPAPKQFFCLVGRRDRLCVVARQEPCLQFEDPVKADHRVHPVLRHQLRLEHRLVKRRVAERGEGCGPALHGRDEALLAHNGIRLVAEPRLSGEVQARLRFPPRFVKRIVPQQEDRDGFVDAVAGVGQSARLDPGAKDRPVEIERGRDWLCPEGS